MELTPSLISIILNRSPKTFSSSSKTFGIHFQEEAVPPQAPETPLNCAHLSHSSGCCLRTALNQHTYQMLGPASFGSCTICLSPQDGVDLVGCL